VLVIGGGLTALDVLSTLIRSGHGGEITVISRRGLRPRSNLPRKAPPDVDLTRALLDRVAGRVAPFIQAVAGNTPAILGLLRALRAQIRAVESAGDTWHMPFDELRDVVWQVWPTLPTLEKKRFMRHLRPWWDAHRFRTPPQNETIVRDAERNGRINFRAARLRSVTQGVDGSICAVLSERGKQNEDVEHFDAVINCESMLLPGRDTIHFSQRYSAKGLSALMEVASGFPLIPSAARSERTVMRTICFESSGRQMSAPSAIQSVPSLSRRRSAELCHVCWKHWESCRSSIGREGYSKALT
jgi:hypothetical protein